MLKVLRRLLTSVVILAAMVAIWAWATWPRAGRLQTRPLVIAHQGGEGLRPSNTLAAFENAVAMGVDLLEMDIHASADSVLVVIHDDSVDRTTNGSGRVKDLTLAEIKALDAGDYWTTDGGQTYPFRGQGITIPTLEEVLQAFPGQRMNIEIKQAEPPIGTLFCDLLRQYDMTDRVLVASFNQSAMDDFRAVCPGVATSATEAEVRTFFYYHLALGTVFYRPPVGISAVQVPEERSGFHILTDRFVRGAHSKGLEVHAWTINETAAMQRVLDSGVDGVITDYPDRLLNLLAATP